MIRAFLFFSLLSFTLSAQLYAQRKSSLADCRKIVGVKDSDRRSFDDRNSFTTEVDGDGQPDTITPRTLTVKSNRKLSSKGKEKAPEIHWIAFDIKTSKGRVLNSFFKYNYGTDEADYWVYAFVPCRVNRDGRAYLLFYSGDDTSEERVILVNRDNVFKVYSRKIKALEE
jgi:hypothetical protein